MPIQGPILEQPISLNAELPHIAIAQHARPLNMHLSSLSSLQSEVSMRGFYYRFFNNLTYAINITMTCCCRAPQIINSAINRILNCCCCRSSQVIAPAIPSPAPAEQVQLPEQPQSHPQIQAEPGAIYQNQAVHEVADVEVPEVEDASDEEPDEEEMLTLRGSRDLVLELHRELITPMQDLIGTPRWAAVQDGMLRLKERLEMSEFENTSLTRNYRLLEVMEKVGEEWERYLPNRDQEPAPFRGDYAEIDDPEEILERLPEFLSRAREELRKDPSEIDIEFIRHVKFTVEPDDEEEEEDNFQELNETLDTVLELVMMHQQHYLQRMEPSENLVRRMTDLDGILQEFSPDRLAALVETPRWNQILAELQQVDEMSPEEIAQFDLLYADKLDVIFCLRKVGLEWKRYHREHEAVAPFRPVNFHHSTPRRRLQLIRQLLGQAREQVRTPPEEIGSTRLAFLGSYLEEYAIFRAQHLRENEEEEIEDMPAEFELALEAIKLARGLKELHDEGFFQRPMQNR